MNRVPSLANDDLDEKSDVPSPKLPGDAFMRSNIFELPEVEIIDDSLLAARPHPSAEIGVASWEAAQSQRAAAAVICAPNFHEHNLSRWDWSHRLQPQRRRPHQTTNHRQA